MHPIWDALLSFRSIDLEEFFTRYPVIFISQWKKSREEGRKEKIERKDKNHNYVGKEVREGKEGPIGACA